MSAAGVKTAVVLTGGLGTRLRPLTYLLPKPLLPVVNIPLVGHQLLWLASQGIEHAILAAGYKADLLAEGLAGRDWGLCLSLVEEPRPLDTAGAIRFAATAHGLEEPFFVTNGDLILDPSLASMMDAHQTSGAVATLLLRRVEDVSPYGLVLRKDDGSVKAFLEKRPCDETGQRTVNAGVYLLSPEVLEAVPEGQSWSVERQLFPDLLASGARLHGYLPAEPYYWLDVGRLETYRQAHRDLLDGCVNWAGAGLDPGAQVSPEAEIRPPVALAEGVQVGAGAVVGPYVAASTGARIGADARVEESILWPRSRVGCGAQVKSSILVSDTILPDGHSTSDRIVMPSDC